MQHSRDRIVTSHAGSLPRPDALIAANQARQSGGDVDEARFQTQLQSAVVDVVRRQQELGIDIPGDGEYGKAMGHRVNYGAWWSYSFQRLGGLDLTGPGAVRHSRPPCAARRGGADQLRRPSRPAALRRGLCRSGIRHHDGTARQDVADLHRPAHLHRPRRDRARHRQLQGGPRRVRHCGGLHDLGRAGQRLAHQQRVLQDRGGVHVRLRRRRCARNTRRSSMRG